MIYEIGRLCVKIAGRDAGQKCVVVDIIDDNMVLIDGMTRRRKCNVGHLEPLNEVIKIKKGASEKEVVDAFKKLGIDLIEKKSKKSTGKPKKAKKTAEKVEKEAKPSKKSIGKVEKEAKPSKTKRVEVVEEEKAEKKPTAKKAPAKKKE